jgi:predicted metal-binding membrane protein
VMLLAITTLSFAAFLLAAMVMHRVEAISHISNVQHLRLPEHGATSLLRIPSSVSISLEALAIVGVLISMLLWTLVTITTPIPSMVSALFRERISPELRERLRKQTV